MVYYIKKYGHHISIEPSRTLEIVSSRVRRTAGWPKFWWDLKIMHHFHFSPPAFCLLSNFSWTGHGLHRPPEIPQPSLKNSTFLSRNKGLHFEALERLCLIWERNPVSLNPRWASTGRLWRISLIKQFPKEKPRDQELSAPFLRIFNFETFHLAEADQGALSVTAGSWQWRRKPRKARSSRASQHILISF